MSEETEAALQRVVDQAIKLHAEANDPQEDRCDELADWIIKEFNVREP